MGSDATFLENNARSLELAFFIIIAIYTSNSMNDMLFQLVPNRACLRSVSGTPFCSVQSNLNDLTTHLREWAQIPQNA
ncbi:hypothetical protein TNCT_307551 [Trichonephila clavata]|uniref:Uncharacterized protein n=1 Tax=Trichonephila clavata TaxID=2740835 RepID=A0A8X6FCE2_TRICU|nr:hypothetical protein TNCT_307551 [Trichonephila clavata]